MRDMEVERQSIGVLWEENEFPAARISPCVFRRRSCSDVDSDSDSDLESTSDTVAMKKRKLDSSLPPGFLDPLPPEVWRAIQHKKMKKTTAVVDEDPSATTTPVSVIPERQFWKAGDDCGGDSSTQLPGGGGGMMDGLRVHPHSNAATWAIAGLLDEVCNGATFVNVLNQKNMSVVEDDGGGMSPDKLLRQCMSLGKSKLAANTIGGNGFKTSTSMRRRLGGAADVMVFSRCCHEDKDGGIRLTRSIGMLSYTFMTRTRKQGIVVPMIDYELKGLGWKKLIRSSLSDWSRNLDTILHWSPYASEEELLGQFSTFQGEGTQIVIYNLREDDDDQGKPELEIKKECIPVHDDDDDRQEIHHHGASVADESNSDDDAYWRDLLCALKAESEECKLILSWLEEAEQKKSKHMDKEQEETLIDSFSEDAEEQQFEGSYCKYDLGIAC